MFVYVFQNLSQEPLTLSLIRVALVDQNAFLYTFCGKEGEAKSCVKKFRVWLRPLSNYTIV